MSKKDSKLYYKPQLVMMYEYAVMSVHNHKYSVRHSDYERFSSFDKKLHSAGVLPRDYSYRLLKHLKEWVAKRGWKTVPVNVFLGDWALNLYISEIGNKQYDDISSDDEDVALLVMDEYKLLQYLVHRNIDKYFPVRSAVRDLWAFMSDAWRDLYDSRQSRSHIQKIAFRLYADSTGVFYTTYDDVLGD